MPADVRSLSSWEYLSMLKLMETLEDQDDVQNVWANFDVSDEVMAAVG